MPSARLSRLPGRLRTCPCRSAALPCRAARWRTAWTASRLSWRRRLPTTSRLAPRAGCRAAGTTRHLCRGRCRCRAPRR
eukprot:14296087-Alexandrium_andersonii.AAC.1